MYPKKGRNDKIRFQNDPRRLYKLKKITHGNRGIPEDPAGTSYMFVAPGNRKEYFTKKSWRLAMEKGWLSLETINEEITDWQGKYDYDFKFKKGQLIRDINPDCPHHGSEGEVTKVTKDEVTYTVRNNGKTYKVGDELTKTKDQLTPLSIEEFINESMSKSQIKKMRDEFEETGELPPHLKKMLKDKKEFEKKFKVKNIVVPGLEWMSDINEGKFTSDQIELLKMSWNTLKGINPTGPTYKKFIKFLDKLPKDQLKQLANAKIKFVSILAKNRIKGESVNEANKMSTSYKLNSRDKHNVEKMWFTLVKDKRKKPGDIKDYISKKLKINYFEVSSYIDKNILGESVNESKSIKLSKDGHVKQIRHPVTNKILKSVNVNGEKYKYNSTYKTYNSVKGNNLLYKNDIGNIRYESVNENSKVYSVDVAEMVDVLSAWEKGRGGYTDGNSYMGKDLHGKKVEPFYNSEAGMQVSGGIKDALKALIKMWKKLDVRPATTIKIFKAYHKLPDSKKKFSNPNFWEAFLEKNGITVVAESVNEAKPKPQSYKFKFQCMECGKSFIKSLKRSLEVKCPKCKSVDIELENINESDLGLTYKKGKTVKVTHNKSGKEIVIIDKPNVRKEYEKIGFFAEGKLTEKAISRDRWDKALDGTWIVYDIPTGKSLNVVKNKEMAIKMMKRELDKSPPRSLNIGIKPLGEGKLTEAKKYSNKLASWFSGTSLNRVKHPTQGNHQLTPDQIKKAPASYKNKLFKAMEKAIKNGDITADHIKKNEGKLTEEVNWSTINTVFIKFLKTNIKILEKFVKAKDLEKTKGGIKSIISGLSNAQRRLKLEGQVNEKIGYFAESIKEGGMGILDKDQTDVLHAIVMKNKSKNSKAILKIVIKDPMFKRVDKRELLGYIEGAKEFVRYMGRTGNESINEKMGPEQYHKYLQYVFDTQFKTPEEKKMKKSIIKKINKSQKKKGLPVFKESVIQLREMIREELQKLNEGPE
jgi:phage FluMu protein Com